MADVKPGDISYSGLYYSDLLQDLLIWRRANVPEITDEDPNEPYNELLRAFSLVGHYSNVLIDHVAREALLPTARLRESVRSLLSLISYELKQPTAATVSVLLKLASALTVDGTLPALMRFATRATESVPAINYEGPSAALALKKSDVFSKVWEYDAGTAVYTDRTDATNNDVPTFTPWVGAPQVGDILYFGHESVLFDKLVLAYDGGAAGAGDIWGKHVWEYYDGQVNDTTPTSVADLGGGNARVVLTTLLGTSNRAGVTVRVRSLVTGRYQDAASLWNGALNYVDVGDLGQAVISTTAANYVVGATWKEPANVVETVKATSGDRHVVFDIPETTKRRWQKSTVNATSAYWIRLRMVTASVTAPTVKRAKLDQGSQYVLITVVQGVTVDENPSDSATGLANQLVTSAYDDLVEGTLQVFVDEGGGVKTEYSVVDDFLSSSSTSRNVTLTYDDDGRAIVMFGDGVNGKIPPAGNGNISLKYRRGGKDDGNVGAGEVSVIKAGSPLISEATSPRPGSGWKMRDGGDDDDLERVKIAGPASLRTLDRALTIDDIETLAKSFVASDGTSPVVRAIATADALGPKTVRLVVVGSGGGAVANEFLAELDEYFNGDPLDAAKPPRLVLNHRLTSVQFTQKAIDVTLNVRGTASLSTSKVIAAVKAFLSPTATETDGTYVHLMTGTVYRSRIAHVAFEADAANIDDVSVVLPAADVVLAGSELPVAGTVTVNVV